jgi:hypothetical protein
MNALVQLLIRHGLASLGGFFAAHQITGSSTSSIIVGLIILAVPTVWSWLANLLHMEDIAPSTFDIGKNEILRTLIGSLVSQGITALSVYFATDANNPELLGVALVNAAASKFGLHQKALGMPGLKLLLLSASVLSLASCSSLVPFMLRHEAEIETAIVYGVKLGTQAGFKKLRTSAKNPVQVQPAKDTKQTETETCLEPGPDAAPRCLKITGIPDYGVRVAAHLAAQ